jgi:hypothetical protein
MKFKEGIDTDDAISKQMIKVEYVSGFFEDELGWDKNLNNLKWVVTSVNDRDLKI